MLAGYDSGGYSSWREFWLLDDGGLLMLRLLLLGLMLRRADGWGYGQRTTSYYLVKRNE